MSDNFNPYTPPEAEMEQSPGNFGSPLNLAGRGARLGASLLDMLVALVVVVPALFIDWLPSVDTPFSSDSAMVFGESMIIIILMLVMLALLIIYAAVQIYFLWKNGQTIGKKILGIKVVRRSGERASLPRLIFLRHMLFSAISRIPYLGNIFFLVDCLLIFRQNKACLHDDAADTMVVYDRG